MGNHSQFSNTGSLSRGRRLPGIFLCIILFPLLIAGCHSMYGISQQELKKCTLQCQEKSHRCEQTCQHNCIRCISKSNTTTGNSYDRYMNEQKIQGKIVIRQLNSYRDPLQCRKLTCNCSSDYKVCSKLCYSAQHKV